MVSICLCMIVKNEEKVIARAIQSVKPYIDRYVICDTGSSDKTVQVAREALKEIKGEIIHREWVNFGHNRTEVFKLAEGLADYMLVLDADDIAEFSFDKETLAAGVYLAQIHSAGLELWQRRLFKSGLGWSYVGVVHEYPVSKLEANEEALMGCNIYSMYDGGSSKISTKYLQHAVLLQEAQRQNPEDTRTVFYLAQSYNAAGLVDEAIKWYRKRIGMGGFLFERFWSAYQIGILEKQRRNYSQALTEFLNACNIDPSRAEPLTQLCQMYRIEKKYHLGMMFGMQARSKQPPRTGFIVKPLYEHVLFDELAICAYWIGEYDISAIYSRYNMESGVPRNYFKNAIRTYDFAMRATMPVAPTIAGAHSFFNSHMFPKFLQFETNTHCNVGCKMCPKGHGLVPNRIADDKTILKITAEAVPYVDSVCPFLYQEPTYKTKLPLDLIKRAAPEVQTTIYTTLSGNFPPFHGLDNIVISYYGKEWQPGIPDDIEDRIQALINLRGKSRTPTITMHYMAVDRPISEWVEYQQKWSNKADNVCVVPYDTFCGTIPDHGNNALYFGQPAAIRTPCPRLWSGMTILANGDVVPCCLDFTGSTPLGNVNEQDPKKIWQSLEFAKLRQMHVKGKWDEIPLCKDCKVWQYQHPKEWNRLWTGPTQ